jgi:hypothetical protein
VSRCNPVALGFNWNFDTQIIGWTLIFKKETVDLKAGLLSINYQYIERTKGITFKLYGGISWVVWVRKGKGIPVYYMKVYRGNRGIAPLIFNLVPGHFTPDNQWMVDGRQNRTGRFGVVPVGNGPPDRPAHTLVTYWLRHPRYGYYKWQLTCSQYVAQIVTCGKCSERNFHLWNNKIYFLKMIRK